MVYNKVTVRLQNTCVRHFIEIHGYSFLRYCVLFLKKTYLYKNKLSKQRILLNFVPSTHLQQMHFLVFFLELRASFKLKESKEKIHFLLTFSYLQFRLYLVCNFDFIRHLLLPQIYVQNKLNILESTMLLIVCLTSMNTKQLVYFCSCLS